MRWGHDDVIIYPYMSDSFQDWFWVQDFEAVLLWKVGLKILYEADTKSFSGL